MTSPPLPEHLICFQVVKDFMNSLPDNGIIVSTPSKDDGVIPADYPAENNAGELAGTLPQKPAPTVLPAKNTAGIKDIEDMIVDYGTGLLRQAGLDGYSVRVKVVPDKAGSFAPKNAGDEDRQAARIARLMRAKDKLGEIDDAGIRQQLSMLSLDAQEVYHLLRERAVDGKAAITADEIADSEGISMSKRSVENALQELRDVGLTTSVGSKKKPIISLTGGIVPSNPTECLLYRATNSNREKNRMMILCNQCILDCPVHQADNQQNNSRV